MNFQVILLLLTSLMGIALGDTWSWGEHKAKYGLQFSSAKEEDKRQSIFANNLNDIQNHNQMAKLGQTS